MTLELANKIYLTNGYGSPLELKPGFKKLTNNIFSTETEKLDNSDPAEAANKVNQWVINKTHGKIHKIINTSKS